MLLRSFSSILLALLLFCFGTARPLPAQPASVASTPLDIDKVDARAFAVLFRHENTYLKMARSASSLDKPEAHLDRVLPQQFELNADDTASLVKVAADWERDTKVLRTQFVQVVDRFHRSFPNGRLGPGVDPTPPSELADLRGQMDAVTLQYRDKLRNTMQEAAFQKLRVNVEKTFANQLQTTNAAQISPAAKAEVAR